MKNFNELLALGKELHAAYAGAVPYPHICLDGFFDAALIDRISAEFPELGGKGDIEFSDPNQVKLASRGEFRFGAATREFVHYLNSQPFLEFLSALTGIEGLIPDPYFKGGGLHEIRRGGFLKIHADFNKHQELQLDRRINLLIYLNKDWEESYGGHFELWDADMKTCVEKILPIFNRMVIFSTTDVSYHGHPDPLSCPDDRSRRSLALYYYTNGRPRGEVRSDNRITTQFRSRENDPTKMKRFNRVKDFVTEVTPPFILKWLFRRMK